MGQPHGPSTRKGQVLTCGQAAAGHHNCLGGRECR